MNDYFLGPLAELGLRQPLGARFNGRTAAEGAAPLASSFPMNFTGRRSSRHMIALDQVANFRIFVLHQSTISRSPSISEPIHIGDA